MTFAQFQATRRFVECIADDIAAAMGDAPSPGYLYAESLYIDKVTERWPEACRALGQWRLLIERDEWISNDLERLERKLYQYGVEAGCFK